MQSGRGALVRDALGADVCRYVLDLRGVVEMGGTQIDADEMSGRARKAAVEFPGAGHGRQKPGGVPAQDNGLVLQAVARPDLEEHDLGGQMLEQGALR